MWRYNFPHNVIKRGELIPGCNNEEWEGYCYQLTEGVYPTALYEIIMCFIFFIILWKLRKMFLPGILFFVYLIFNGIERFLIEKIRVNQSYDFICFNLTQAEIISFALIITGVTFIILTKNKIIFKTE